MQSSSNKKLSSQERNLHMGSFNKNVNMRSLNKNELPISNSFSQNALIAEEEEKCPDQDPASIDGP